MEEYLHLMKKQPLVDGINEDELYTPIKYCGAEQVMILLKGKRAVVHKNFWGKKEELYCMREGEAFREIYSCVRTPGFPMSVAAKEDCEVQHFGLYERRNER